MKTIATALVLSALSGPVVAPARAAMSYAPAPATAARYTCEGQALSRIAARSEPAPCCTGMLGCPQLLANTGLIKPKRANRT